MKISYISVWLIFGWLLAHGTVQDTLTQDKPTRLYVKSYNFTVSYNELFDFVNPDLYSGSENFSFEDQSGGSYAQASQYDFTGSTSYGNASETIDISPSGWPSVMGTAVYTWFYNGLNSGSSSNSSDNITGLQQEQGSISLSDSPYPPFTRNCSETIVTTMHLETGGGATSHLKNLFGINASATGYANPTDFYFSDSEPGDLSWYGPSTGVSPQNIAIGSYGTLNTNGMIYLILPDNADVDVTPSVAGAAFDSFYISYTKYQSYFDLYVFQPYPGYSIIPMNLTNYLEPGHAMWSFETQIPTNVLSFLPANELSLLQPYTVVGGMFSSTPGIPCGFYPNTETNNFLGFGVYPGYLQMNDGDIRYADIMRRFYISFTGLQAGLNYTIGLSNNPPNYSFLFAGYGPNCVGAARNAGYSAGLSQGTGIENIGEALPTDQSPQNFGVDLIGYYPGPFITTEPYYPISSSY